MKRNRLQSLIAVFCALCLLGAQQAVYAHVIGHAGGVVGTAKHATGDGDAPAGSCNTCTAFAALGAAPPSFAAPLAMPQGMTLPLPAVPLGAYTPAPLPPPYASRAPPAAL